MNCQEAVQYPACANSRQQEVSWVNLLGFSDLVQLSCHPARIVQPRSLQGLVHHKLPNDCPDFTQTQGASTQFANDCWHLRMFRTELPRPPHCQCQLLPAKGSLHWVWAICPAKPRLHNSQGVPRVYLPGSPKKDVTVRGAAWGGGGGFWLPKIALQRLGGTGALNICGSKTGTLNGTLVNGNLD